MDARSCLKMFIESQTGRRNYCIRNGRSSIAGELRFAKVGKIE
jgi:hypothetical protein